MTKFFFHKGGEKRGPLRSQSIGIFWLSAGLLLAAGAAFFSLKRPAKGDVDKAQSVADSLILAHREDSVYRSRRRSEWKSESKSNYRKPYNNRSTTALPAFDTSAASVYGRAAARKPLVVELNSADSLTLQLLRGIGPVYASRIVRYRERLGGYVDLHQLLEVRGITPELLASIGPHLLIDSTAIARLKVNSIELKQLLRHPYIEYYQARDIMRLQQGGVRFGSVEEMRAVPSMTDSTLARLAPYLDFEATTE